MKRDELIEPVKAEKPMIKQMVHGHTRSSKLHFSNLVNLTTGLKSILNGNSSSRFQAAVLSREPNIYASTSASEIVTYRLTNGCLLWIFCKYGTGYLDNNFIRRGVPYEAKVYCKVLEKNRFSTPRFYGSFRDEDTGETLMAIEYLDNCFRVNKSYDRSAMKLAAHWIGRFHAVNEKLLLMGSVSNLNIYSAKYFAKWRRRMSAIPNHLKRNYLWLSDLCERSDIFVDLLLTETSTIIHGEYYPSNALIRNGEIYVVDWESAGIGAGEIDLAFLTQGPWPEEILRECEEQYRMARWSEVTPSVFDQTFSAAKLYAYFQLVFYWLRFRPNRANQEVWAFEHMRSLGERLGLI